MAQFSKRHYEMLARTLNMALGATMNKDETDGVLLAARYISTALGMENPRFDASRFAEAVRNGIKKNAA